MAPTDVGGHGPRTARSHPHWDRRRPKGHRWRTTTTDEAERRWLRSARRAGQQAQQAQRTEAGTEQTAGATERAESTPFTQQFGRIALAVVAILFGIFAAFNAQYVSFDWIFGGTQVTMQNGERLSGGVPLIILMVASFAAGGIVGWLATWRRTRR